MSKKPTDTPDDQSVQKFLKKAEIMVTQEPWKAFASACGAGMLLNMLPVRFLAGTASTIAVTLVRPALLTLGLLKAFELATPKLQLNTTHEHSN